MAKNACKTCAWEKKTGTNVDTSRSKAKWAKIIKVDEASIRRHLAHSIVLEEAQAYLSRETDIDQLLDKMNVPEGAVTSRGMSLRDPVSGSWQKVNWSPAKKALIDSMAYPDLAEALDGWRPAALKTQFGLSSKAAILNVADLQIGKADQRGGGTPETLASARDSFQAFAEHVKSSRILTVVIADNGDPIENCFNVPSQLVTNDLDVPEQIRVFRRLMLEGIKLIAPLVDRLVYVTVPSNHGAHRTGYKSQGGTTDADFGLEISHQIEDAIAENPFLNNVEFVRPKPLFETAEVDVAGTKLAFHHGHQSGGVFGHGKFWSNMDHGRMPGWDADILVMGHFHTQAMYQSGDGRWVVATASSDPGSDWYTNRTGERAERGMTTFDFIDGSISNIRII